MMTLFPVDNNLGGRNGLWNVVGHPRKTWLTIIWYDIHGMHAKNTYRKPWSAYRLVTLFLMCGRGCGAPYQPRWNLNHASVQYMALPGSPVYGTSMYRHIPIPSSWDWSIANPNTAIQCQRSRNCVLEQMFYRFRWISTDSLRSFNNLCQC